MPSSSLVEVEVGVGVEVEIEAGVVFHNVDVHLIQFRYSLDFFHFLHGWVAGWVVGWEIGEYC